jgi:hypothetical protein
VLSAFNEVEEMSPQHFWALAAAFSFAALVHALYDRVMPDDEIGAFTFVLMLAAIAYVCGRLRERRGGDFAVGFLLGTLFGFFALPIVWFMPARVPRPGRGMKACDRCFSSVRREASICRGCQQVLEPWSFAHRRWWQGRWSRVDADGRRLVFDERHHRWSEDDRPFDGVDLNAVPPMPMTVILDAAEAREETSQHGP